MTTGRWRRLAWSGLVVCTATAAVSHAAARALHVGEPPPTRLVVGAALSGAPVAVVGSSTTLYGIAHAELAQALGRPLVLRLAPSGSPAELEPLLAEIPGPFATVIGVSAYDLNELVLADSRPRLVPLRRAVADLRATGASWPFAKRVLGQYLLDGVRRAFPTAGHASLVMVGLREALRGRLPAAGSDATAPRVVAFDPGSIRDDGPGLDAWPASERLRNLANYRAAGRAEQAFFGPKWLALRRMTGPSSGRTVVLVLPVSSLYAREFLAPRDQAAFDGVIADVARNAKDARVLRMDRDPLLQSDAAFSDLVHLGPAGRRRVTGVLADALAAR